jgi:uncharacterized protein involved in propanediol utilization
MNAVAGHFGEWIQGRLGLDGSIALITVACPALTVRVDPEGQALFSADQVRRFLDHLGLPVPDLTTVKCDMPIGGGAGASTACLVALARAAGFCGSAQELAGACLHIEGASDPLMFAAPDQLLWASRQGRVVRHLPAPPRAEIVGGFWGAPQRTDHKDSLFPDVSDLAEAWETAQDLSVAAALASQSAQRCDVLRQARSPLTKLIPQTGALGELRAHTGSARGLIFAPGTVPDGVERHLKQLGLTDVLRFQTGGSQ